MKFNSLQVFLLLFLIAQPALGQIFPGHKIENAKNRDNPVVRWTADQDEMNFRYNFLENTETFTLYTATPETGTFSHHSHITYFNGVFYACWDNHVRDENGSGQRGLLRRSRDQCKTWTLVEELFPSLDEKVPASEAYIHTRFQTSNGFAVVDSMLYALTDVAEWTGPSIRHRRRISLIRLCRFINPDGTLGKIFRLRSDPPDPVEGFHGYPAGEPVLVEKINKYLSLPNNELQLNFTVSHPVSDDNHRLSEPTSAWKLGDGTWVKLYRDGGIKNASSLKEIEESKSRRNYASFSFDVGKSWTTPTRTNFPDAYARTNAGIFPNGQIYVINNVLPLSTKKGGRILLAISLSKDGLIFDRVAVIRFLSPPKRYEGRAKAVGYQYPHSVVVGNNLWVIYSVNKEDIQLTRIPLAELVKL
ncbi:MAG: exo-alpha-sialidase [Bacteroidales bacterium]|nr:exo-alpha-sialidase [Bacteroidales bacterium]